jgi:hypothetical protein
VAGNITLSNPVFVMERLSGEWIPDAEYQVFTGEGKITLTGAPTFEPAIPAEGYVWDYSQLASAGILKVVADPSAIESINPDELGDSEVYDLQGRKVENPVSGLYIVNGKKVFIR